jgi:DNA processing protein
MATVQDYLRFHLAEGIGPITFRRMVEAFGSVDQILAAPVSRWQGVQGVSRKRARAILDVSESQIESECKAAAQTGTSILCPEDAAFPAALKNIYDPPPVLYVRGRMEEQDASAIAVVGSRRSTHYGLGQAERFGRLLATSGFTVVSGGARGIDTAAHRGAVAGGGRTLVVMGCGLGHVYPPENAGFFEEVVGADAGALISELPMNAPARSENFPKRNRIVSGLSLGVLVIEAANRSGALITANVASEQGRSVFALPGQVDSPLSQGCHKLIRQGVTLVTCLEDILEDLGQVGQEMTPTDRQVDQPAIMPELSQDEAALVRCLAQGALQVDELARRTGLSSGKAASLLTMLLLKGVVEQRPGNVFARKKWVSLEA